MEPSQLTHLAGVSKRLARRLLTIGENRLELLLVEVEEERDRLLLAILMALGVAVFGLLAGVTLTFVVAMAFWEHSPVIALVVLMAIYLVTAAVLYGRLLKLKRNWQTLAATLDQFRKDRECLEKTLT